MTKTSGDNEHNLSTNQRPAFGGKSFQLDGTLITSEGLFGEFRDIIALIVYEIVVRNHWLDRCIDARTHRQRDGQTPIIFIAPQITAWDNYTDSKL